MMIADEKLEHYALHYHAMTAVRFADYRMRLYKNRSGSLKQRYRCTGSLPVTPAEFQRFREQQETFYHYLQRMQGEFNMKDFQINRHPLPLMARLRRRLRRWFGKGKHHAQA